MASNINPCCVIRRLPLHLDLFMTLTFATLLSPDLELQTRTDKELHIKLRLVVLFPKMVPFVVLACHVTRIQCGFDGTDLLHAVMLRAPRQLARFHSGHDYLCAPRISFAAKRDFVSETLVYAVLQIDHLALASV